MGHACGDPNYCTTKGTIVTNSRETLAEIGEFGLIRKLASKLPGHAPEVLLGIGDDAAVVDIDGGRYLLATCDIQIENIHFTRHGFTPEQIGWKAAAVNLSDIAAMGGIPRYALVSLAVPPKMTPDYLVQVYAGLGDCLSRFGACVIGGNTSKSTEGLIVDVTLLGETDAAHLLTRKGAAVGDVLCVTGALGASRAGLMLISSDGISVGDSVRAAALDRHRMPQPRIGEARIAATHGVSACMDVSDGLLGDAQRLAEASGVKVVIDISRVPVDDTVRSLADALGGDPEDIALHGGEDFELLLTISADRVDSLKAELERKTGTPLTAIGRIEKGEGAALSQKSRSGANNDGGFDHFR